MGQKRDISTKPVEPIRVQGTSAQVWQGRWEKKTDQLTVEAPLEIRIESEAFTVVMRTPGDDDVLARGLLYGEGVITAVEEVFCQVTTNVPALDVGNVINVMGGDRELTAPNDRALVSNSSCGVCGKLSLESLRNAAEVVWHRTELSEDWVVTLPILLKKWQKDFEQTGSIHAAAVFAFGEQAPRCVYEDIGRHNAVDKCVGFLLGKGLGPGYALVVSGRVSFEIIQKAARAQIEVVVAVSGVSSLAKEMAHSAGVTLCGFVRGSRFVCYEGVERFRGALPNSCRGETK